MASDIDWAAEGLLDGLEGGARAARERLLDRLHGQGVGLAELRAAVDEGRLAALPAQLLLGGAPRWSAREAAERHGLDLEFLLALRRANGVPVLDPNAPVLSDADLEVGAVTRAVGESGVTREQIEASARVMGHALRQVAQQFSDVLFELTYDAEADELELAERLESQVELLQPLVDESLRTGLRLHFREAVRDSAIAAAQRAAHGGLAGEREIAVAFADLVGFTRYGEEVPAEELERVARRLSELGTLVADPPVSVVKTIGDAVMLVSPDAGALVRAMLRLVALAEAEGPDYPLVRAGVAFGPALARGGDWFGRPVNLASRLTSIARAGSVLVSQDVHEAAGEAGLRFSRAGVRRLRGVPEAVPTFRARLPEPEPPAADAAAGS
jgi:adenylate cyclase